ncbi:MAG: glycerophosphodiester phosphodiesterase family protein [Gammaproteobacteria bacterium WSBS_2016_MAG_OTU1]
MFALARFIGHRGLAAHAPENTLAGIRRAAESGLRWVEIDVRLAADGVAVLSHDDSLRRCGGGSVRIRHENSARLAQIPVSCGFAEYAQECVPSLTDVLALANELNIGVVVEIKPDRKNDEAVVDAVACAIDEASARGSTAANFVSRLIISSFSMPMLAAAQRQIPEIARAVNCNRITTAAFENVKKYDAQNLHCAENNRRSTITKVAAICGVYCFTVNDAKSARELFEAGAHGIFTNQGQMNLENLEDEKSTRDLFDDGAHDVVTDRRQINY